MHVDSDGERTITVIGSRLGPEGRDPLPWGELDGTDAIYFTAGDVEAVRAARAAKMLVSTARGLATLREAGVQLDALVASARDPGERYESGELDPPPRYVIRTAGRDGGEYETADGRRGSWRATPLPGPISDLYGCGDSFAAGLTYGLGAGLPDRAGARPGRPLRRRLRHRTRPLRRSAARGLSARPRGRRRARSGARP